MPTTVSALGERALIARLRARLAPDPDFVRVGIGDDAAVVAPERGALEVVTTDSLVEGVHFRREWTAARAIGHKALAVNLSDIAAMGATPRISLLSLALPQDFPLDDFDALIDGYAALGASTRTALVGGNLSRSPGPLTIGVTVIGAVRPRRLLQRGGAREGDELFVTGEPGASAAGLALLMTGTGRAGATPDEIACLARHEQPEPRLRIARLVANTGAASAAMDLSDGLADAATQMAEASGLGVVVRAGAIPCHPVIASIAAARGESPALFALVGGEDYELAFAVPARRRGRFLAAARRCPGLRVTAVGRFVADVGAWLEEDGVRTPFPKGFQHF